MWFNIPLFPERAATLANQVDYLYFFLILNTVFFTLVVASAVAYFSMRYRRIRSVLRPILRHAQLRHDRLSVCDGPARVSGLDHHRRRGLAGAAGREIFSTVGLHYLPSRRFAGARAESGGHLWQSGVAD